MRRRLPVAALAALVTGVVVLVVAVGLAIGARSGPDPADAGRPAAAVVPCSPASTGGLVLTDKGRAMQAEWPRGIYLPVCVCRGA